MRLAIPTVVALLAALAVTAATEEAKPSTAVSTHDHSKHDWPWHKDDDKKASTRVILCRMYISMHPPPASLIHATLTISLTTTHPIATGLGEEEARRQAREAWQAREAREAPRQAPRQAPREAHAACHPAGQGRLVRARRLL